MNGFALAYREDGPRRKAGKTECASTLAGELCALGVLGKVVQGNPMQFGHARLAQGLLFGQSQITLNQIPARKRAGKISPAASPSQENQMIDTWDPTTNRTEYAAGLGRSFCE